MKLSISFLLLTLGITFTSPEWKTVIRVSHEDWGHELGGLELTHIAEVPVFDQDEYDLDFSDEHTTIKDNLIQWLNKQVMTI